MYKIVNLDWFTQLLLEFKSQHFFFRSKSSKPKKDRHICPLYTLYSTFLIWMYVLCCFFYSLLYLFSENVFLKIIRWMALYKMKDDGNGNFKWYIIGRQTYGRCWHSFFFKYSFFVLTYDVCLRYMSHTVLVFIF